MPHSSTVLETMDISNSRRGACDRCRGQKLRCVGPAKPISNPGSRYQRNEIPCQRCKRAKAECYSVGPTPRRRPTLDRRHEDRVIDMRSRSEVPSIISRQQRNSLPAQSFAGAATGPVRAQNGQALNQAPQGSATSQDYDLQSYRPIPDVDTPSTMRTTSSDWTTYIQDDDMDWNDISLETRSQVLGADLTLGRGSAIDNSRNQNMIDITANPTSVEWNSGHINTNTCLDNIGSINNASFNALRHSDLTHRTSLAGQSEIPSKELAQNLESSKAGIRELARLNEKLLSGKSSFEDLSPQKGVENDQWKIGQILQNCQDFLSILWRFRSSSFQPEAIASRTVSEWSSPGENERLKHNSRLHPPARQSTSSSAIQPLPYSGMSSASSSSRSSSTSSTPAAPYLEIPTLLSILSCYTSVLQSFDNLFTPMLKGITRSTPFIPTTLSGIRLDGFELDDYNTLQLECLTSVSYNMLQRMETILVGTSGCGGLLSQAGGGLLADKVFAGLIDALYDKNERNDGLHRIGKRELRAKRLILEIQAALKVIDL